MWLAAKRFRELHVDVQVSLVFVGQEAGGTFPHKTPSPANTAMQPGQVPLSESSRCTPDVKIGAAIKLAIEPAEELRKRAMRLFLGPEKSERRA